MKKNIFDLMHTDYVTSDFLWSSLIFYVGK